MEIQDVFGDLPTLTTARLCLRKLAPEDLESIFAYTSDPEVARFTTWQPHASIEVSRDFLTYVLGQYDRGEVAPWGIEHRHDAKVIGTCGFVGWSLRHARAEIGYAMSRAYWNRGLMTEALRAVLDLGFREMHLNRIQGCCVVENIGSARVMEKAGMQLEGIRWQYEAADTPGDYLDIQLHAVLRQDWVCCETGNS